MTPIILHAAFFNYNNVGLDSNVELLRQEVLLNSKNFAPTDFTNENCWRGNQPLKNISFLLDAITDAVNEQINYYSKIDNVFSSYKDKKIDINYWANVNSPGSRNVLHAHKTAVLSGVYYINGSDTGDLRISNPANILGECNPQSPFARDFFFSPKDKDLIMWPSWLPHEVEPNLSNYSRVNIAFDVRFRNEN